MGKNLKREFKKKLTVLLIPHNSAKPFKLSLSLPFLAFMLVFWSVLTVWAGFISGRHVDYWRTKMDNNLMRLRVSFFAQEIRKSREVLDHVKSNDESLRELLNMNSRKAIVEKESSRAVGGPSKEDLESLKVVLSNGLYDMTHHEIARETAALREETSRRLESFSEITNYVEKERTLYRATPNIWPTLGDITSRFGMRMHPIFKRSDFHLGVDIANSRNTPIYATADGIVRWSSWESGYGRVIVMDHNFGYRTIYAHLQKAVIKNGMRIRRGQLIGYMGSSGNATASHLHYEIHLNGNPKNPSKFLKKQRSEIAADL